MLTEQDEFEQAILYYQNSLHLNPQDITVFVNLGKIHENLDLLDQADSLIAQGLVLDSANLRLLSSKAKVNYKCKNYKGVVESVQHLLKDQPDTTVRMMQILGIAHFHLQNLDKSIALLDQVIQIGRETEFIHYYLGLALRSAGELDKSAYHFEETVRNGISENIAIYYTNLGISMKSSKTMANP